MITMMIMIEMFQWGKEGEYTIEAEARTMATTFGRLSRDIHLPGTKMGSLQTIEAEARRPSTDLDHKESRYGGGVSQLIVEEPFDFIRHHKTVIQISNDGRDTSSTLFVDEASLFASSFAQQLLNMCLTIAMLFILALFKHLHLPITIQRKQLSIFEKSQPAHIRKRYRQPTKLTRVYTCITYSSCL